MYGKGGIKMIMTYFMVWGILFLFCVWVTRCIFSISKIVSELEKIRFQLEKQNKKVEDNK